MIATRRTILVVASLFTVISTAADAYYAVPLSDFKDAMSSLPTTYDSNNRLYVRHDAMRPYVLLDGPGEAYLDMPWSPRHVQTLAIRTPEPRDVTGRLVFPKNDWSGMAAVRFSVPATAAREEARTAFLNAKKEAYEALLARNIPGGAWFKHVLRELRAARGEGTKAKVLVEKRGADELGDTLIEQREWEQRRAGELEDTYDLFTGGKAMSENLQLDRLMPPLGKAEELVAMSELKGITIAEIKWELHIKDLKPELDPLAAYIPVDQHAVFFPSFSAMVSLMDEANLQGTPVLNLLSPRAEDAMTKDRYEKQLCMTVSGLSRLLGPHAIASVAFTGSDTYLPTGSDVAVLFQAKLPDVLKTFMLAKQAAAAQTPEANSVTGEIAGVPYRGVATPDRSISSYLASLDAVVIVTNSLAQLERIVGARRGSVPALAGAPEYTFFRNRYQRGADDESAFLILTDATIRRWCGPEWRIGSSRRTRAHALMSELQAAHLSELAGGSVEQVALQVPSNLHVPELGELRLTKQGIVSSTYGSLSFQTPIVELKLDRVTKAEADAYTRWRDGYQSNWRRYFDPIAVRLTVAKDRVAADLTVMPLIAGTEYREFMEVAKDAAIAPDAGDRHGGALLHLAVAVNRESLPVRQVAGFASAMVPQLRADPLGWLGSSLAIYADEDPFWDELARAENPERFVEENVYRLPVALHVEVGNSLTAALFLTSLRTYIEQTSPGMTVWEPLTYREQAYMLIRPVVGVGFGPADKLAFHYATSPRGIVLTLNEDLLKRSLDRRIAAAEKEKAGGGDAKRPDAAPAPWLGESICLHADQKVVSVIEGFSRDGYRRALELLSWSNLPILNEWKKRFPGAEPNELHGTWWHSRLVCPGGGRYVWNEEWQTMESTVFGHPAVPREAPEIPFSVRDFSSGNFGVTFEPMGLRARAVLKRDGRTAGAPPK